MKFSNDKFTCFTKEYNSMYRALIQKYPKVTKIKEVTRNII